MRREREGTPKARAKEGQKKRTDVGPEKCHHESGNNTANLPNLSRATNLDFTLLPGISLKEGHILVSKKLVEGKVLFVMLHFVGVN